MGSEVCVNSKGARLCALEQMSEVLECECLYLIATWTHTFILTCPINPPFLEGSLEGMWGNQGDVSGGVCLSGPDMLCKYSRGAAGFSSPK